MVLTVSFEISMIPSTVYLKIAIHKHEIFPIYYEEWTSWCFKKFFSTNKLSSDYILAFDYMFLALYQTDTWSSCFKFVFSTLHKWWCIINIIYTYIYVINSSRWLSYQVSSRSGGRAFLASSIRKFWMTTVVLICSFLLCQKNRQH